MPYGATTAVFHVARTDVDNDEDVPRFDFPTDDGVELESSTQEHAGRRLYRIEGELWRTEVIEGSRISERVLGQEAPAAVEFIVDAAGNRETRDTLQHGSRWLWFEPQIVKAILQWRGSFLTWYTQDTGEIGLIPGWGVHFGINKLGLINVYAKDIALLPDWQQRIWAGANLAPDGGVSTELLDSQMRATPAKTQAPESWLKRVYDSVNQATAQATGMPLFRPHQAADELFLKIHRFRAIDRFGLFELAKDLARLTVESIDGRALTVLAPPPSKSKSGSIKHLEVVLAGILDETTARQITGVLVGINELRQADAHMPSSDVDDSLDLAGVQERGISIQEAEQMLQTLTDSLSAIDSALRSS